MYLSQVEVFFDYHNFIATPAPLEEYLTQKDVTCTNRTDAKQLNFEMPTSFSFTSEFVSYLSNSTRDIVMLQPRQVVMPGIFKQNIDMRVWLIHSIQTAIDVSS